MSDGTERDLELGIARVEPPTATGGANTMYYHTDHLGTTRLMSDSSGYAATGWHSVGDPTNVLPSVFSAFGEHVSTTDPFDGESNRYGYVGAHGYQAHDQSHMRFLHVGYRYYDPGSGRFLQRDPIGIRGGLNVYVMAFNNPLSYIDPDGMARRRSRKQAKELINDLGNGDPGHGSFRLACDAWNSVPGRDPNSRIGDPDQVFPNARPEDLPGPIDTVINWLFSGPRHSGKPSPGSNHGCTVGCGCFVSGTLIATEDGLITVDCIQTGAQVLVSGSVLAPTYIAVIESVTSYWTLELVVLRAGGEEIRCTTEHPFWVIGRGWVKAGQLTPFDTLQDSTRRPVPIERIQLEKYSTPIRVYNIEVRGSHTYFVSPLRLLVHNKNV